MTFEEYRESVERYRGSVEKIIILGGEPTLHRDLERMIRYNLSVNLKTTVYTNGARLDRLEELMQESFARKNVSIRIGVHGLSVSEKPLVRVPRTSLPVTIVYMLARYNVKELADAASYAEEHFNCNEFYISSIREMDRTGDFWADTERTVSMSEYARIVQAFVDEYAGQIRTLHLATRGVLVTNRQTFAEVTRCRIGSILRDGSAVLSPLDISQGITSSQLEFDWQPCKRHHKCVLQKIVLERTAP
jgi:sulfatase maturation enzyme AslB (radical SAM superfamily)